MAGIGDILSGVGSIISAGTGIYNSVQGNKLNREQFNYSKDLQQKIFDREDTAVQRRAKDLESSGMSKWLAAGQGAGTGSVVGTNLEHKNVELGNLAELGAMIQSFQKQRAEIGETEANTLLLRDKLLTEIQKRNNMRADEDKSRADADYTRYSKNKIDADIKAIDQNIIESQSRVDRNDISSATSYYNLFKSMMTGRRTTDPAEKKLIKEVLRSIGASLPSVFSSDYWKNMTGGYLRGRGASR